MPSVADLVPKVRQALGVSSEYEAITIPHGIRRVMKRLMRDYNFPKSVRRFEVAGVAIGTQSFDLPTGLKRPLEVRFRNPVDGTFTNRLQRREGFTLPTGEDYAELRYGAYYWLEGSKLWVDRPMPVAGLTFTLWHQSLLVDAFAEDWLLTDVEDLIFTSSVTRLAVELRKPEVAGAMGPLMQEEMQSIAIYANELEWNGVEVQMREPAAMPTARYPAGAVVA
jgi:hypothetical protein